MENDASKQMLKGDMLMEEIHIQAILKGLIPMPYEHSIQILMKGMMPMTSHSQLEILKKGVLPM